MGAEISSPQAIPARLEITTAVTPHCGGTVVYRVTVDGRGIGWVGDGREWRGSRYGARRWWACWREAGDTAARWSTGLTFTSRSAAKEALVQEHARPGSDMDRQVAEDRSRKSAALAELAKTTGLQWKRWTPTDRPGRYVVTFDGELIGIVGPGRVELRGSNHKVKTWWPTASVGGQLRAEKTVGLAAQAIAVRVVGPERTQP